MTKESREKIVPDTSVIISGILSDLIGKGEIAAEIIIPEFVVEELRSQASRGKEIGFRGLEEMKKIRSLAEEKKITLRKTGRRQTFEEIKLAKYGRIDALILDVAREENAVIYTSDMVQSLVAEAEGIRTRFFKPYEKEKKIRLEQFLTPDTMSLHLKERCAPLAKRGKPGEFKLVKIREEVMTSEEVEHICKEIMDAVRYEEDAFFEIGAHGANVVQLGDKRIAITRPPFSDSVEITVVRPIIKLVLDEYKLSRKLLERLEKRAEGIIIAGPPGSGKCLPGFEKVFLANGETKTVKEIYENKSIEMLSVEESGNLSIKKPVNFYNRKVEKLLKLTTRTGREICVTEEHPLLSMKDGYPTWVQAKDIIFGEKIAAIKKIPVNTTVQKINWLEVLDENKIWIRLAKDTNYEIPIEESLMGQSKDIAIFIRDNPLCNSRDIEKAGCGNSREIKKKLLRLYKNELVKRKKIDRGGNAFYRYILAKKDWKPRKNDVIKLKLFKEFVKEKGLSLEEAHNYVETIYKRDLHHYSSEIKCPLFFTSDIAEFLGYYVAESIKKIGISTDTETARKRFREIAENTFGLKMKEEPARFSVYTDEYATIDHFLTSCFNCVCILENKRSYKHSVPQILFRATNQEVAAFLRAYFSTEASIDINKGCIGAISASENLIKGIQNLLLRFGIVSVISKRIIKKYPDNTYHRLEIYGYRNRKLFYENIGFLDEKKQKKLIGTLDRAGFMSTELIPAGPLLKALNKMLNLGYDNYDLTKNEYSSERLGRYIALVEKNQLTEKTKQLLSLLKFTCSDFIFWDRVDKIEIMNGDFDVYDFEIPDTHNFIAGSAPIIVHNSTFAASLAEFYERRGKIVKTMESPRDLQVIPEITQYTKLDGSFANTADMLLLVRPDYTIFDEVRKTEEFRIFADMRLAGIGMVGVVHASNPIDAVQRFIGRIELGMIPHIIDTIIFIKDGEIKEIFDLSLVVRVPTGMTEADLSRPVVEVRDFEDGKLTFEIYTYGEENVIIPVKEAEHESAIRKLAKQQITQHIRRFDKRADVEIAADNKAVVRVDNDMIARIIGKQGRTIKELEEELGISIEVLPKVATLGKEVPFDKSETGAYMVFTLDTKHSSKVANFYVQDRYLFSATVGKSGAIRVSKDSSEGRELMTAIIKENLKIFV